MAKEQEIQVYAEEPRRYLIARASAGFDAGKKAVESAKGGVFRVPAIWLNQQVRQERCYEDDVSRNGNWVREDAVYVPNKGKELVRILHPEGSICWQVGNYVDKGEIFPLDIFYYEIFKQHGLKLRNRIVWHFGHGLHARKRFSGRYETLLWFTKSDNYTFNLDPIRVPSKYPNKKYFKGDKKGEISGNPLGKNPSDFWEAIYQEWEKEIWEIPNVKSNHPEKTIHPCQFPVELVERCVLALTDNDDWIYDPYAGVGSALIAGIKNDRKVIGSEKEKEYVDISKKRIVSLMNGELKLRPMGKPIYDPKRTAKENSQAQLRSYANNQ